MTPRGLRGLLLAEVLAGREVSGVSMPRMHQLCDDLAALTPRRYLRAHGEAGGGYRVALVGLPVEAYARELP